MAPARKATFRKLAEGESIVLEGFEPRNHGFDVDGMPQILIQESWAQAHALWTRDQVEGYLQTQYRSVLERSGQRPLGAIVLDQDKNRFTVQIEMILANGAKVRGIHYGFLGKDRWVVIICYTHDRDFQRHKPAFDAMADSFKFDDSFQFVSFDFARLGWICAAVGVAACCLVGAIIAVIRIRFKLTAKK